MRQQRRQMLKKQSAGQHAKSGSLDSGINGAALCNAQFADRILNHLCDQRVAGALQLHSDLPPLVEQRAHGAVQEVAGADGFVMLLEEDDILGRKFRHGLGALRGDRKEKP